MREAAADEPTVGEQITTAVGAHGAWKRRLATAVAAGTHAEDVAQVAADNRCAFGTWLHGATVAGDDRSHLERCRSLHATFHQEAAAVLRLVSARDVEQARTAIAPGGAFAEASRHLTKAMIGWRTATTG